MRNKERDVKYVVAGFKSYFRDDVIKECHFCGRVVYHRPYLGEVVALCLPCLPELEHLSKPVKMVMHPETIREVAEFIRKEKH